MSTGDDDVRWVMAATRSAGSAMLRPFRRALRRFEHERDETTTEVTARWHFDITVESDPLDGGYMAFIADLPGVMSQGDTQREAVQNLSEAFADVLFARLEQANPEQASAQQQLFEVPQDSPVHPHRRPRVAIAR